MQCYNDINIGGGGGSINIRIEQLYNLLIQQLDEFWQLSQKNAEYISIKGADIDIKNKEWIVQETIIKFTNKVNQQLDISKLDKKYIITKYIKNNKK